MKIKEIIVVEGKNDTEKIKLAVDADTIETNGSEISKDVLKQIKIAQERRGVIVFTDPDYPGERIRRIIESYVPNVKHAFLVKEKAKAKSGRGLGIEHASIHAIRHALAHVYEIREVSEEFVSWETLVEFELVGGSHARKRRAQLGEILNIGYMNAKQLYKRLNAFQIRYDELMDALHKMKEVEKDDR